jgi:hypothetical protein
MRIMPNRVFHKVLLNFKRFFITYLSNRALSFAALVVCSITSVSSESLNSFITSFTTLSASELSPDFQKLFN